MSDAKKLLAAARAGKLETILKLAGVGANGSDPDDDPSDQDDADLTAYKWLLVAADLGHEAEDWIEAMHTGTSFHHDDDQGAEASVHFELGVAYLRGEDGLKIDHAFGRDHLETAHDLKLHKTSDIATTFTAIRRTLTLEAVAVFDRVFKPQAEKRSKPAAKSSPARRAGGAKQPAAAKRSTRTKPR